MRTFGRLTGLTVLAALATSAFAAPSLAPGMAAPAIKVAGWSKGTPVTSFNKGQIYVVEFWATWCGPCRTSIPHITELANNNKDVTFIGVSVWERGDDIPGMVNKFVNEMGDKMNYNVCYDDGMTMAETWMRAAKQNGIPTAFIVDKDGTIAWIGHPMSMDQPLAEIKSGKFDKAGFQKEFAAEMAAEEAAAAATASINAARKMYAEGKRTEALKALDDLAKGGPNAGVKASATMAAIDLVSKDNAADFSARLKAAAAKKDPMMRQQISQWAMSQARVKGGSPDRAREAMETALAMGKDDAIIRYYASLTCESMSDIPNAIKHMEAAIAVVNGDAAMKDSAQGKQMLEVFGKKLEELKSKG